MLYLQTTLILENRDFIAKYNFIYQRNQYLRNDYTEADSSFVAEYFHRSDVLNKHHV